MTDTKSGHADRRHCNYPVISIEGEPDLEHNQLEEVAHLRDLLADVNPVLDNELA